MSTAQLAARSLMGCSRWEYLLSDCEKLILCTFRPFAKASSSESGCASDCYPECGMVSELGDCKSSVRRASIAKMINKKQIFMIGRVRRCVEALPESVCLFYLF